MSKFCTSCGSPLQEGAAGECPKCGRHGAKAAAEPGTVVEAQLRLRSRRLHRLLAVLAAGLLAVIILCLFTGFAQKLRLRYAVREGGWDIVAISGYDEMPGFSITGVSLRAQERADATVELGFSSVDSLCTNDSIRIVRIGDVEFSEISTRLLEAPWLSAEQRQALQHYRGSIDVKDTGPFGMLFSQPIRNLNDLRVHYDEVFGAFRRLAAGEKAVRRGSEKGNGKG